MKILFIDKIDLLIIGGGRGREKWNNYRLDIYIRKLSIKIKLFLAISFQHKITKEKNEPEQISADRTNSTETG